MRSILGVGVPDAIELRADVSGEKVPLGTRPFMQYSGPEFQAFKPKSDRSDPDVDPRTNRVLSTHSAGMCAWRDLGPVDRREVFRYRVLVY
jgi:hypothetical protein